MQAEPMNRERLGNETILVAGAVKADVDAQVGMMACSDAAGLLVPAADAAGLVFAGYVFRGLNNAGGIDGDPADLEAGPNAEVDILGTYLYNVSGASPLPLRPAYVVDNDTVSAAATTNNIKAGVFVQPGPAGMWFVRHADAR